MLLEEIIKKYPHVYNKETYEELDALSGVLAFIFVDLVDHYGLANNTSQRKGFLFEKAQVINNRVKELDILIN